MNAYRNEAMVLVAMLLASAICALVIALLGGPHG
jgi:hypothetical protein